jgi:hypothetical protein
MTALVRRYHLNEKLVSFTTTNELKGKSLEEILNEKALCIAEISEYGCERSEFLLEPFVQAPK